MKTKAAFASLTLTIALGAAACGGTSTDTPPPTDAPAANVTSEAPAATTAHESAERFCANLMAGNVAGVVASFTKEGFESATPLSEYFDVFAHLTDEPHLEAAPDGQPNHFVIFAPTTGGTRAVLTSWVQVNGRWLIDKVSMAPPRGEQQS